MSCDIPLPPAIYDHVPSEQFQVVSMSWPAVDLFCRQHGVGQDKTIVQACAIRRGIWFIILPNDQDKDWTMCAMRHEFGHVNGWPSSHPDARFE